MSGPITSILLNEDKIGRGDLWAVDSLPRLAHRHLLSRDNHVIIWTSQSPADVLLLFPRVNVKLIHVDRSDRKMSMPPDLNTGVRNAKTEPIATQFAILPPPYSCIKADFTWYLFLPVHTGVS